MAASDMCVLRSSLTAFSVCLPPARSLGLGVPGSNGLLSFFSPANNLSFLVSSLPNLLPVGGGTTKKKDEEKKKQK